MEKAETGRHDNTRQEAAQQGLAADDEINLLDLLLVLARRKKMVLVACSSVFLLACGIALLKPDIYTATARILPPQEGKGRLQAFLGGAGDLAALAGLPVSVSSGDLYVGMLKSRNVADSVIDRFDLMKVYGQRYRSSAYAALGEHVAISVEKKDGIISIHVDDEDPQRAAGMANAYVEALKRLTVELNLNSAGRERSFLEDRLKLVREDLSGAEDALKEFQQKNKTIRIDDQASAIIEAISRLKGEVASKEVQLGVLLSYQTEQSPQVKALRAEIAQLKRQVQGMDRSPAGEKTSGDIFIATSDVPELGIQYARLLRDFKIQETLYELLTKQYEIAKINEAKNTSTIQVLDEAVTPDRRSKPKRSLFVLVATFGAGVIATFLAFVREAFSRMSEPQRARWEQVKSEVFRRPAR